MNRVPLRVVNRPPCFGAIRRGDVLCRRCKVTASCKKLQGVFAAFDSLSQAAFKARAVVDPVSAVDKDGDYILWDVYRKCYRVAYVRYPSNRSRPRVVLTLVQVDRFCRKSRYDLAIYVLSNMMALKESLLRVNRTFQPNMLLGDNAEMRYRAYAARCLDKYGALSATVVSSDSVRRFKEFVDVEVGVGSVMVNRPGVSLKEAAEVEDVTDDWKKAAVSAAQLLEAARLEAARSVAASRIPGLAARIGVRGAFDWAAMADCMAEFKTASRRPVSAVGGVWIPGRGVAQP